MIVLKMADSEGGKIARLQYCIICGRKIPMAYFMDTIPETVRMAFRTKTSWRGYGMHIHN